MADITVDPDCTDPKELFGQGVRAFVLQDYENSVLALSKASELLVVEHKDDLHDSLAEVYLYYGKALLGLSREQNEALGDAVPKNSEEGSEDEDEVTESETPETSKTDENGEKTAEEETNEESEKDDSQKGSKDNGEMETEGEDQAESSKPEPMESNGEPGPSSSQKEGGDEATDEQNGDEDTSDLQVAWEVLELAKKIFERLGDKKSLAETLIVLGEVSLESENFECAINDIKQGLDIQKEIFTKDSRTIAESLYKLGMAYSTNRQLDEAIESFNHSLDYLRNRIKTLEEIKSMTQEHKDEIEEIKSLIPDIEDKIADMGVYKEEAKREIAEALKEPAKPIQDGAGSSKQVTNISHLVKRKRKLDESEEKAAEEVPAKKPAA